MPTQIELVRESSVDSNNWYEKYPWFSLGQLINVSNKKQPETFQTAAQSIAIYFNDTQRLHWLLNEQVFNKNKILNDLTVPFSTESMQDTPQPFPKREHPQAITAPTHLIAIAAVEENDAIAAGFIEPREEDIVIGDVILHNQLNNVDAAEFSESKNKEKIGEVANNDSLLQQTNIYVQQPEETKEAEQIIKNVISPVEKTKSLSEVPTTIVTSEEAKNGIDDETLVENKPTNTADNLESITKAQENIKNVLDNADSLSISFEPYHTIDYFASQGIKVDLKADDRLGKQLKSFTSWLKSMKRLPVGEEAITDTQINQLQDKSLENSNVFTEAMAAVLLKQGKKEQAVEIFKKLSLLHPEKSRYFAAQIEQIKN